MPVKRTPLTLKKRKHLMGKFHALYGEYSLDMPTAKIVEMRDSMIETPAAADSMVEGIRSLYRWACNVGICDVNPAVGVGKADKGKGKPDDDENEDEDDEEEDDDS